MEYVLKASAISIIFYVCYILFLQRETFFASNRWFLMLGLVSTVLLPLLVIPIYVEAATLNPFDGFAMINTTTQNAPEVFDITSLLIWVYSIGVTFFIGRLIIQLFSLIAIMKKSDKKKFEAYTYVETRQTTTPFSFFKWIVYNPKQFNAQELQLILQHEKVHAKQLHSIDVLFMDLATALCWFNPMIWLYRKAVKQNLEFIADYHTQKQSNCDARYQKLLLKTSFPEQNLLLINTFYNSTIRLKICGKKIVLFTSFGQVKKRILMLHKSKSNLMNSWKYTIIAPLLVIFAMTFNTKTIAKTADQVSETLEEQQNMLKFVITKDSKDNELDLIKDKFAERGITIVFKNVKRNSKNEITTIKIKHEFKGQRDVYYSKLSEPIRHIDISFNASTKVIHMKQRASASTQVSDDDFTVENFKPTSIQVTSGKTKLSSNGTIAALIIANGKEITKEEMEAINPNTIESLSVLKHENATKIYGEKAKDGVILMTLRKENSFNDDRQEIINTHNKDIKFTTDKVGLTNPEGEDKGLLIIKKDTKKTTSYVGKKSPLIILDGKEISDDQMKAIDKNTIESVEVLKRDATTKEYGKKGENGVLIITSKKEIANIYDVKSALYIIDGKEFTKNQMEAIDPNTIESIDILKDESATKKYGEKGKNGVILITLKKD